MKRYELLLNLALLLIIGGLIYLIYSSKDLPKDLDELDVPVASAAASGERGGSRSGRSGSGSVDEEDGAEADADSDSATGDDDSGDIDSVRAPGRETEYGASGTLPDDDDDDSDDTDNDDTAAADDESTGSVEVASASPEDQFGQRNIFRSLLTPTPTPPPPTPTPKPTPDINQALGAWRLLSVYNGKALIEDVRLSAEEAEGAIWEMPEGGTKQVDVGNGVMKAATLKEISSDNPYNPEIILSLEDTKTERKINLDTEPVVAPAKQEKKD